MKEIIVINGSGGVGKDTFVEYCKEYCKVKNISSVDKVKEAAAILTGWNGIKDDKARKLLSDLKRIGVEYNDAPFRYVLKSIEEFEKEEEELMFIHIREIDEIQKVKSATNAKTLLVTNKNIKLITSNESDKNVKNYTYDYYIKNDGTLEDLNCIAQTFVNGLKKKENFKEEIKE